MEQQRQCAKRYIHFISRVTCIYFNVTFKLVQESILLENRENIQFSVSFQDSVSFAKALRKCLRKCLTIVRALMSNVGAAS